ncbi:MAG: hypothetical protein IVW52_18500 [Acidimicrobiales bacterium]|nr:hypothetical protein [Acidimicrobiales bacterium]
MATSLATRTAGRVPKRDGITNWVVWSPEFKGSQMVVEGELTEDEAIEAADRRNRMAARAGIVGGYTALPQSDSGFKKRKP